MHHSAIRPAAIFTTSILAAASTLLATQAPSVTPVLALSGGTNIDPTAISADGTYIVGESSSENGTRPFRWSFAGGIQDLGALPEGPASAFGVSNDGSLVVGRGGFIGQDRAMTWTPANGVTQLLTQRSIAKGVSGDGSVIVGEYSPVLGGPVRAFRSTVGGGFQDLGTLDPTNASSSIAYAVSRDGSTVLGVTGTGGPNGVANFRWRQSTGLVALPNLAGAWSTISAAISQDGQVAAGYAYVDPSSRVVRWNSQGVIEDLGHLPGAFFTQVYCISDDGRIIGGYAGTESGNVGFLWTRDAGFIDLKAHLAARGADLSRWQLASVTAISADGSTITGSGYLDGFPRMFVVSNFALPCTRSDVAGANQSVGADGNLTADDIIVFLGWFFASDPRADVAGPNQSTTPDQAFTADDVVVFFNRFFAGCQG